MGCDIHLALEAKTEIEGITKWRNIDNYKFDYYDDEYWPVPAYKDRDYDLFAALADVRNRGFITPMANPRGIPSDIHSHSRRLVDRWEGDAHSHSHCTLQELYDYQDKYFEYEVSGYMTEGEAAKVDAGGEPAIYCQGTNSPGYVFRRWTRKESPVDHFIKDIEIAAKPTFYMQYVKGRIPAETAVNIRVIFFFDN